MSVISEYTVQERGDQNYFVPNSELDGNARGCIGIHSASDFPIGTKIVITAIEPEMQIVMPEGMRWIENENCNKILCTKDGAAIARVCRDGNPNYSEPRTFQWKLLEEQNSQVEGQQAILELFAEKGWYGVRHKYANKKEKQLPPTIPTIY